MRFRRYLQQLERGLEVPYPARKGLLQEIASHLEDLYGELRKEGLDEKTAEERAIRTMALDESFISSIDEVHAPLVRQALALLPAPVSLLIEHIGIGLLAAIVFVCVIVKEEPMISFFSEGGFFMIPLNLMGLAILILIGERVFSLFIKKDHSEGNLSRRLVSLKFLGRASILVGIIGTLMGYFRAFSVADRVMEKYEGIFPFWEVSRIAITTTIWGLTIALVSLIGWYVIRAKTMHIEQMRM
jgi:hypothetical protein